MLYFNPRTREGCDEDGLEVTFHDSFISIHAPVKGATTARQMKSAGLLYFNPRTREGCDYAWL